MCMVLLITKLSLADTGYYVAMIVTLGFLSVFYFITYAWIIVFDWWRFVCVCVCVCVCVRACLSANKRSCLYVQGFYWDKLSPWFDSEGKMAPLAEILYETVCVCVCMYT